ncbi:MAG: hypothetical protein MUP80_09220 [Acidobacteriia bacterium]|nr:hypothetical protein [Terriglobia bacterium]
MHFFSGVFVKDVRENAYKMTPNVQLQGVLMKQGADLCCSGRYMELLAFYGSSGTNVFPDTSLKEILNVLRQKAASCRQVPHDNFPVLAPHLNGPDPRVEDCREVAISEDPFQREMLLLKQAF